MYKYRNNFVVVVCLFAIVVSFLDGNLILVIETSDIKTRVI